MPSPSSSLATLRPDLAGSFTEFDLAMDRQGFVGSQVLSVIDVGEQSGKFGKIPLEQLLRAGTTSRASGGGYSRGEWTFTDASYATEEHGWEEPVDDREARIYQNYFNAEQVSANRARDMVLREMEKRIADLVFNTTTWTGASLTTAVSNKWDDQANGTPIADVTGARIKVRENSGMWPNAVVMEREAFIRARATDEVRDAIASSGAGDPNKLSDITAQQLAQAFDVDRLIVAGSVKNTANEGAAASLATVWTKTQCMVCRVAETEDIREPCIGRIFHYSEDGSEITGTVEEYREERTRSNIIRVRNDVDEQILYKEMGHLLTGVL